MSNDRMNQKRRGSMWLLAAFTALLLPGVASAAWWNDDWGFRKRLPIDPAIASATTSAGLTEVAVPVRLHAGNFGFFNDVQKSAGDLRFVAADDKTPLEFRVERLDTAAALAVVWVKIPVNRLGPGLSYIWMYYGSPEAPSVASSQVEDAAVVASYDFAESSGPPRDSTAYASHAVASTARNGVSGAVDLALGFDAQSTVSLPLTPAFAFDPGKGTTFAAWVRVEAGAAPGLLYSQSGVDGRLELSVGPAEVTAKIGASGRETRVAAPISDGWHYLGLSVGERLALYIDGTEAQSMAAPPIRLNAAPVLGAVGSAPSFTGALDSLRVANVARPAGWFQLEYMMQKPDAQAITYGDDESRSSGGMQKELALVSQLLGSVTIDGWIVIGLIALLGIVSGDVLASKLRQLRRAERGDSAFLNAFSTRWAADAAQLASSGALPDAVSSGSPLQRMYAHGLAELGVALKQSGGRRRVPAEYLGVIRSALDVRIVEETDSLNRRLVLMTIAVSGGPFLGLLGTVVGVMITFASIAATGDVNVNTIAPGVAAALFATVAGLLVAIPSLFGYNIVASRVGARVSAMDVFADQLVARMTAAFTGEPAVAETARAA